MNWDKRNVYDFDTRIHLLIKGPGIKPGSSFEFLASNVDIAPTMLSLAGIERPPGMDGKSFLPILPMATTEEEGGAVPGSVERYLKAHPTTAVRSGWRDAHFIEYYYIGIGGYCGMKEPIEQPDNNFIAIRKVDAATGVDMLYAEFQNGTDGNIDFKDPEHFELFVSAWRTVVFRHRSTSDLPPQLQLLIPEAVG